MLITSDDFRASGMRGLNFGTVHTAEELKVKNLPAARATGANHSRYWITIAHDANDVYFFSDRFGKSLGTEPLTTLDAAIASARSLGMYLIPTLNVLPNQAKCDLWGNDKRKNGVINIWRQIAERYKGEPVIAAYDLINEPRVAPTNKEYLDWQIKIIEAIRAIEPARTIIVEVLRNQMLGDPKVNDKYTFTDMATIAKIPNLVFSPHGYSALGRDGKAGLRLTHQGVPPEVTRYKYPSTEFPSNLFSSNTYWYVPTQFARKYNVPLWCGEFSCINWAPKNSAGQWSSTRWIEDAIKYMQQQGWSWAYHAWREYQGWDGEIQSSFYENKTFVDGHPSPYPTYSEWKAGRSATAPTLVMLKKYFSLNTKYFQP